MAALTWLDVWLLRHQKRVNYVGASFLPLVHQELTFKGFKKANTLPISTEPYERVGVHSTARQTLAFPCSFWALGLGPKATLLPSVVSWLRARSSALEEVTLSPLRAIQEGWRGTVQDKLASAQNSCDICTLQAPMLHGCT